MTSQYATVAHIAWAFNVLVTGLLIGLGTSFWFEIAVKLARIKQGLKTKGKTVTVQGDTAKANESKSTIDTIIENKVFIEAEFKEVIYAE